MGALTCRVVEAAEDLELAGRCGRGDDLAAAVARARADVVVDFTRPEAVRANALSIVNAGARPVIGTSGLDAAAIDELARSCAARRLGGLIAPNFAIGAVLMMRLAAIAARHMSAVEILEAHHPAKRDAPSATALATADSIAAARGGGLAAAPAADGAARGLHRSGIPIHSTRLPGIVAEQSVVFGEVGQKLVIEHVAYDREAFMPGVLLACRRVTTLDRLVVGLDRLLLDDSV